MSDYYKDLGVRRDASQTEIEEAYLQLTSLYHIDEDRSLDSKKLEQVSKAYFVLSHPDRRRQFDGHLRSLRHYEAEEPANLKVQALKDLEPKSDTQEVAYTEILIDGLIYSIIFLSFTLLSGAIGHHLIGPQFDKYVFFHPYEAVYSHWVIFTVVSALVFVSIKRQYKFAKLLLKTLLICLVMIPVSSLMLVLAVPQLVSEEGLADMFLYFLNFDLKYIMTYIFVYLIAYVVMYMLADLAWITIKGHAPLRLEEENIKKP